MTKRHSSTTRDVYQRVTDSILQSIDQGAGRWELPWARRLSLPVNAVTAHRYRGINVVSLWAASTLAGWGHEWGSYKQWQKAGAQVRRGERGSVVVFYKTIEREKRDSEPADGGESEIERLYVARGSVVFNAAQVDGYEPAPEPERPLFERLEAAEGFVANSGAAVVHGGERAFYRPSADTVHMPQREAFVGTSTSSAQEAYYGTLLHELTHWTGHERRCARDLRHRFGSEAYAAEELVAELGAAFLCAELGISPAPRLDHAKYIESWLRALKNDKRAIFTAASKAAQAADYLKNLQEPVAQAA